MNRLFIADKDFNRTISRNRAKGYKRIIVDDALDVASPFKFETSGTDLKVSPAELTEGEGECYTMLCKEIGLVGWSRSHFTSKVSVIFCDNGWMLVTLREGAVIVNLDDQLMMPVVGDGLKQNEVRKDDILWVDANQLLGYGKNLDADKKYFLYDYEFMMELGGDSCNGMRSIKFKPVKEEDIDISLGYIALWQQQCVRKQEAREAQKMAKAVFSWSPEPREFDEPVYADEINVDTSEAEEEGIVYM